MFVFIGVMSSECNSVSASLINALPVSGLCVASVCGLQVPVCVAVNAGLVEVAGRWIWIEKKQHVVMIYQRNSPTDAC